MSLKTWLKTENIKFIENFDFSKRSWIKAGGKAEYFIKPENLDELLSIIRYFRLNKLSFYTLGNISNVIIRDGLIKTPIINLNNYNKIEVLSSNRSEILIKINAGASMNKLVKFLTDNEIYNLSGSVGIPGTVGGAIYMNASSFEDQLSNYVHGVESIDEFGNLEILKKEECDFKWRSSIFKNKKNIITDIILLFKKTITSQKDKEKKKKFIIERSYFQENRLPNLGSLFATKDLYKDIRNISIIFFILYLIKKISSVLAKKISNKSLIKTRKELSKLYSYFFNIKKNAKFKISDKTINCVVNCGTEKSKDGIELIENLKKRFKNKVDLEIVILKNIE